VQVEANGTTLTLTDMRGPGLSARGGRKILFGNDAKITSAAFLEAGAYSGDQRYVVGHPFPNQTYFVSSDAGTAGWRGDGGKLVYTVQPPSTGTARLQGNTGAQRDVVSVSIPAFGIPVVITPSARINPDVDTNINYELRTWVGSTLASYGPGDSFGWSGTVGKGIVAGGVTLGPYSTAQTVKADAYLRFSGSSTSGIQWYTSATGQNMLQVIVEPANIEPIRVWL
jgi:hypothetical protein